MSQLVVYESDAMRIANKPHARFEHEMSPTARALFSYEFTKADEVFMNLLAKNHNPVIVEEWCEHPQKKRSFQPVKCVCDLGLDPCCPIHGIR